MLTQPVLARSSPRGLSRRVLRPDPRPRRPARRVFEDEGDGKVHLVADDAAVVDQDVHVLDPAALDVPQRARGAVYPLPYGLLEALGRDGAYLGYGSHGHRAFTPSSPSRFPLGCVVTVPAAA